MSTRMRSAIFTVLILAILFTLLNLSQLPQGQAAASQPTLSVHWEELTASDFREGIHRS